MLHTWTRWNQHLAQKDKCKYNLSRSIVSSGCIQSVKPMWAVQCPSVNMFILLRKSVTCWCLPSALQWLVPSLSCHWFERLYFLSCNSRSAKSHHLSVSEMVYQILLNLWTKSIYSCWVSWDQGSNVIWRRMIEIYSKITCLSLPIPITLWFQVQQFDIINATTCTAVIFLYSV